MPGQLKGNERTPGKMTGSLRNYFSGGHTFIPAKISQLVSLYIMMLRQTGLIMPPGGIEAPAGVTNYAKSQRRRRPAKPVTP
jgi:hypothetical protein